MKKINLKYIAKKVAEIEDEKGAPIAECVLDNRIKNLVFFVSKGYVDEEGKIGISEEKAEEMITEYLQENDTDELLFDIIESLVNCGFLSRKINVKKWREAKDKEVQEMLKNAEN